MKQLDEMERVALGCMADEAYGPAYVSARESTLARALLAVMPVVRAAIAVDDDETNNHRKVLRNAIDELRRRLGGE